ncbi:MAG: acetyl-CoA carboxylase biotin carboxyl carrier protein [Candidatus Limnocylindrales bacterium]
MPDRKEAARLADHAQIESLAADLVPALIAKLGASGLAELEVREGNWKVRLRRPPDGQAGGSPTVIARSARPSAGHADYGHLEAGHPGHRPSTDPPDPYRTAATSPAVGVYQPRPEISSGSRVRAGDRIASVDVLGIPQEVVAPADGIVGAGLVQGGDVVEYGQELVWIELISAPAERAGREA